MKPCMGGWCRIREGCPNYERRGPNPAERLCLRGCDGTKRHQRAVPVRVIRIGNAGTTASEAA